MKPGKFFTVMLLFPFFLLGAETPRLYIEADTTQGTIGDQFQVTIFAYSPPGWIVKAPKFQRELGALELIQKDYNQEESGTGIVLDKYELTVAVFDTGKQSLPSFEFQFSSLLDSTQKISLKTNPIVFHIHSVITPADTTIRGAKPPLPLKFRILWWWILIIILVVLITILGFRYFRRKRTQDIVPSFIPPMEPPDVVALRKLQEIREGDLLKNGNVKSYYDRITDVLREYMEHRYYIRALEMITPEILQISSDLMNRKIFDLLEELLETADRVKFAKYVPPPDEFEPFLNRAEDFVKQTHDELHHELAAASQIYEKQERQ
jgi:hypothetical protein